MGTFNRLGRAITPVLQRLRRGIFTPPPPGTPSPEHLTSTGRFIEPLEQRIIADLSLLASEVGGGAKYPDEIQITWVPPGGDHTDSTVVMQNPDGSWTEEGDFMDDYPGPFVGTFDEASDDMTYTFGMVDPGDFPGSAPIEQASVSTPTIINSVSVTGGQVTLSWDSGDASHMFDVDVNGTPTSVGSDTQYTFNGDPDQTYAFNITDTTTGTTSDEVDITTGPPPPTLTATVSGSDVDIEWDPAGGSSTSINLFRGTTPDFTPSSDNLLASMMAEGSGYTDTAPASGTRYYYKGIGVNDASLSSKPSTVIGVGTLAAPTAVHALRGSASAHVLVSWTPAVGSVQTLVERSTNSGSTWTTVDTISNSTADAAGNCSYLDTTAPSSGPLEYRVTSEDGLSPDGTGDDYATTGTASSPVTVSNLVGTTAAPSTSTVTGTSVELAAAGAYDDGSDTYTWATTGTPPATVYFPDNGDNSANSAEADFSTAGTYGFEVTIADGGISSTSDTSVDVVDTANELTVSPAFPTIAESSTQQFSATAVDQWGNSISVPSDLAWSVTGSGAGSINSSSGLYSAPSSAGGPFAITASSSSTGVSDSATVTVATEAGPVGDWQFDHTGINTALDDSGFGNDGTLQNSPTWSGASDGATGLFFDGSSQYVSVPDSSTLDPTSALTVGAYINPTTWTSAATLLQKGTGGGLQYSLFASDGTHLEFEVGGVGDVIASAPTTGQWDSIVGTYNGSTIALYVNGTETSTSATGSINTSTGDLDIGDKPGSSSDSDSFNGTIAEAKVYNIVPSSIAGIFPAPTVSTSASPSSSTVTGTTVDLSVLGESPTTDDDSNLTYNWVATSVPDGAADPSFSDNGDNSAKDTTATFFQAGAYDLECQISDGVLTTTTATSVTVDQTLTSIQVTPGSASVPHSATYALSPIALDQFGNAMSTQPTFSWSAGSGSITSDGVFTAPSSASSAITITAAASSISGTASFTLDSNAVSRSAVPASPTEVDAYAEDGTDAEVTWLPGDTTESYSLTLSGTGTANDGSYTLTYDYNDNTWSGSTGMEGSSVSVTQDATGLWTMTITGNGGANPWISYTASGTIGSPELPTSGWTRVDGTGTGTPSLTSLTHSGGDSPDGYIVEAEAEGDSYQPIGTAGPNSTEFLATNLTANQGYSFEVIPFNSDGQGTGVEGGVKDGDTFDPIIVGSASAAGWYKVSFNDPDDPTATSEDFQTGSTEYTDTGTLTLSDSGWIQADSEADAVQQALSGSIFTDNGDVSWVLGQSGAFQFNPYLQNGDTDIGPAVVVEDEFNSSDHGDHDFNDANVPVSIIQDQVSTTASSDQTLYSVPSGALSVGTFQSSDPDATASQFTAKVYWEDSSETDASITTLGNGKFGIYVSSGAPSDTGVNGGDPQNFTITVAKSASGISDSDRLGYGGPAPTTVVAASKQKNVQLPGAPVAAVFLQSEQTYQNQTNTKETFHTWAARGINTLIDSADYESVGQLGDDSASDLLGLAYWIGKARAAHMRYILPVYSIQAIYLAQTDTSNATLATKLDTDLGNKDEWDDGSLIAVGISVDEPNSGDTEATLKESHLQIQEEARLIHHNLKPVYINLAGPTFETDSGTPFLSTREWGDNADILSVDYYPADRGHDMSFSDQEAEGKNANTGYDLLAHVLGLVHSFNPGASFEAVLECSEQELMISGETITAVPTPQEMGDEYITALQNGVRGICWFPQLIDGSGGAAVDEDWTTPAEQQEMLEIDNNLTSGGASTFLSDPGFKDIAPVYPNTPT